MSFISADTHPTSTRVPRRFKLTHDRRGIAAFRPNRILGGWRAERSSVSWSQARRSCSLPPVLGRSGGGRSDVITYSLAAALIAAVCGVIDRRGRNRGLPERQRAGLLDQ